MGTVRKYIYFCCVVDYNFNYHSNLIQLSHMIVNHKGIDKCMRLIEEKYPFPIKAIVSLSYLGRED